MHKLTAGDGYTYLTRQVAAHDATDRGHQGLADYYAEKGESPGRWFGTGLSVLGLPAGSEVTEAHMRNLFGEGRHPEAERLENAALDAGQSVLLAKKASQLGRVFSIYRGNQPEFIQATAQRYIAYNLAHGRHWKTPVPAEVRARIRTELGNELFLREHGRAPLDDRERGSFMAKATRQQTTAVAGYDLTFTPVKSVSTLWALADRDVAAQIEEAHHGAVEATLRWLESEALFTRRGRGGIQQVKTKGLIAGMFTHRDARSSDPHLHTHVAVSNKVQAADGQWLAIDGRVIYKANVTCSETYNTLLESELIARLGVRFKSRSRGPIKGSDKRPVREIVGIDDRLAKAWSKRHNAIEARRRELAAAFQTSHGRPPTEGEAVTLAEQAWDQTRQAKHEPRSESDQRAAWLEEAAAIIGGEQAVRTMVQTCLGHSPTTQPVTDAWVRQTAKTVVDRVAEDRATWQIWHLRAEAQRQARADSIRLVDLDAAVNRVVDAAITAHSLRIGGGSRDPDPLIRAATAAEHGVAIPAPLQRTEHVHGPGSAGEEVVSVYSLAGARQFTSRAVIEAEQRILDHARRTGSRTISDVRVGIAIAETAANSAATGLDLNAAQQSLVREMATSGRAVQLALAPAGTGKTTAMQVLTRAWQDSGGTVLGLAPSAVAAQELGAAINPSRADERAEPGLPESVSAKPSLRKPRRSASQRVRTETLAKLVFHTTTHVGPTTWMEAIDHKTLVLIDEAGMAATTDLACAIDYITSRGGQVRLVGDDKQLASISAGGVLRDIAHQIGAVTLTEVQRFRNRDGSPNHAEAAATLTLRDGDPSAIAFYADRGRIHVGDLGACADQAYAAWAADRAANAGAGARAQGTESILIAPTRELVAELNTRARNDRIAGRSEREIGRVLPLADGTLVSAEDQIITRENDRRLPITRTDWVKNGDRWHVTRVHADGSLSVVHDTLGKKITLPADYVARAVQLGYATTVHGAQGITTGTSHVVLSGEEDRNLLYVALSRGRYANHLYLSVASDGDPHNLIRPDALIPPTAIDRLTQMLGRDGSPISATTTLREQTNPRRLLGDLAARYHDAVTTGAESLIGPAGLARIDDHAEAVLAGLTEAPAWPTLRSHLALLALDNHDPLQLLDTAMAVGSLTDARDPAAVLDARVDDLAATLPAAHSAGMRGGDPNDKAGLPSSSGNPETTDRPLPWLPGIPAELAENLDWGPFLATYHQRVRDQVAIVRKTAGEWTGVTAPAWAQPFLEDEDTDLRADLAVWRAVTDTPETDLRPTGERTIGAPGAHQRKLNRAVREARPSYPFSQRTWYRALPEKVRADPWITPLCQRLARLERAGLPVADHILHALTSDPTNATTDPTTEPDPPPAAQHGSGRGARPLPEEHQAAALWWRLVPHLGPAALDGDQRSADLLQPAWRSTLPELVGVAKADYLQTAPAWPALVAAVDEACQHHGWTPHDILAAALTGIPDDGSLTGVEVADALVLRIAMLTDEPTSTAHGETGAFVDAPIDAAGDPLNADLLPPEDADEFMAAFYRDLVDDATPVDNTLTHAENLVPAEDDDLDPHRSAPSGASGEDEPTYDNDSWASYQPADDPYLPRMPWQQDAHEVTSEHAFPDPRQVTAARIVELNQQAAAYFESCYPRSWAPGYLRERLGADLTEPTTAPPGPHPGAHTGPVSTGVAFAVGYAPGSGRSLLRHLTARGATLDELHQAGLLAHRERSDGRTYYTDFFKDRLVLPIRDPHDPTGQSILGFLGRRNPTKDDEDYAGPKFLNTKNTTSFTKGEALFGFAEAADLLTAGALPVIVEGPIDALAITLGSNGDAVGLAPMGTALTVNQIKLLRRHINLVDGRTRIAVATDADAPGWTSAQRDFWHLTAADLDPALIQLPDGLDPAQLLQTQGAEAIAAAIENRVPLGDAMLDHLLRDAGHWSAPVVRQAIIGQAARILAARGSECWLPAFEELRARLHLAPGILEHQTVSESMTRDRNRIAYAQARIEEINNLARAQKARAGTAQRPTPADKPAAVAAHTGHEQTIPQPPAPNPASPEPPRPPR